MSEEWRTVPSMLGYEASNLGRVRRNGRIIVGSVSRSTGYRRTVVYVDGKRRDALFHRLVAAAFIGECPIEMNVNHVDGIKTNNAATNLEYVTVADNLRHAWRTGLSPRGARHGRYTKPECSARGERVNTAKLDAERVRAIRELRASGATLKEIAASAGISKSQASNIVNGRQWRHV